MKKTPNFNRIREKINKIAEQAKQSVNIERKHDNIKYSSPEFQKSVN